jgi:hypothetical protein
MVIVKVPVVGTVFTSKVLVVKSADVKLVVVGPGVVTLENLIKSPTNKPCPALLIVTVVDPVIDV